MAIGAIFNSLLYCPVSSSAPNHLNSEKELKQEIATIENKIVESEKEYSEIEKKIEFSRKNSEQILSDLEEKISEEKEVKSKINSQNISLKKLKFDQQNFRMNLDLELKQLAESENQISELEKIIQKLKESKTLLVESIDVGRSNLKKMNEVQRKIDEELLVGNQALALIVNEKIEIESRLQSENQVILTAKQEALEVQELLRIKKRSLEKLKKKLSRVFTQKDKPRE